MAQSSVLVHVVMLVLLSEYVLGKREVASFDKVQLQAVDDLGQPEGISWAQMDDPEVTTTNDEGVPVDKVSSTGDVPLRVVQWNLAGPQDNPFEFYLDGYGAPEDDSGTEDEDDSVEETQKAVTLVQKNVELYLKSGITIEQVFGDRIRGLLGKMKEMKDLAPNKMQETIIRTRYNEIKGQNVMWFFTDKVIQTSRVISIPDRSLKGIKSCDGKDHLRPVLTNCHESQFSSMDDWWQAWLNNMFDTEATMCKVDKETKEKTEEKKPVYAALSPKGLMKYEEEMQELEASGTANCLKHHRENINAGIGMQLLYTAIADLILMDAVLGETSVKVPDAVPGYADKLRLDVCKEMIEKKDQNTLEVLKPYMSVEGSRADIITLVEASSFIVGEMQKQEDYHVQAPAKLTSQNSVVLLRKELFNLAMGEDARMMGSTRQILDEYANGEKKGPDGKVKKTGPPGELTYATAALKMKEGEWVPCLIGAYHAISKGKDSVGVVAKLHEANQDNILIIGIDANTEWQQIKKDTQEDVCRFYYANADLDLGSVFQDDEILDSTRDECKVLDFVESPDLKTRTSMCADFYAAMAENKESISQLENSASTLKARSKVCSQPGKGVEFEKILQKVDKHPKDHVVYNNKRVYFKAVNRRNSIEALAPYSGVDPMPSLTRKFPSDHALIEADLMVRSKPSELGKDRVKPKKEPKDCKKTATTTETEASETESSKKSRGAQTEVYLVHSALALALLFF